MTPHRHYSYFWRRCRECGRPAIDTSEYCEECRDQIEAEEAEAREQEADGFDAAYDDAIATEAEISAQIENDAAAAQSADSVPRDFPCTCTHRYAPLGSLEPPEPLPDRLCPQHGDGGPDPDRAYEERRDQIMEDRLHGYRDNNED